MSTTNYLSTMYDLLAALFRRKGSAKERTVLVSTLMHRVQESLETLSKQYNSGVDTDSLRVSVSAFESSNGSGNRWIRTLAATPFWALSIRADESETEFFLFPAIEMPSIVQAEMPSRRKLRMRLADEGGALQWFMDNIVVSNDDMQALLLGLFRDLTKLSVTDYGRVPAHVRVRLQDHSATGVIRELLGDKQRLIRSLVGEQESAKLRIAHEIHDLVIGDLMFLERSLNGDTRPDDATMCEIVRGLTAKLRSISADLAPRDLHDWGLSTMLRDLGIRYAKRMPATCDVVCPDELPVMPDEIDLHIYRIVQECLTNAEKHSQANQVTIVVELNDNVIRITVTDNGVGFALDESIANSDQRGTGAAIMRERVELMSATCPSSISLTSTLGIGTTVTLSVELHH